VSTFFEQCRKSYASGLGTLFAYERQIPEVATFKIDALKKHYAIDQESTLEFFEVHRKADVYHTDTLKKLLNELTPEEQVEAEQSATIAADHLWKFLDGIQNTMAC
jgi:pyrroloquinoline-quinone synthase